MPAVQRYLRRNKRRGEVSTLAGRKRVPAAGDMPVAYSGKVLWAASTEVANDAPGFVDQVVDERVRGG